MFCIIYSTEERRDGIRIHFEVSFEPIFTAVTTSEVTAVLARELTSPTTYFSRYTTYPETLHIEVFNILSNNLNLLRYLSMF